MSPGPCTSDSPLSRSPLGPLAWAAAVAAVLWMSLAGALGAQVVADASPARLRPSALAPDACIPHPGGRDPIVRHIRETMVRADVESALRTLDGLEPTLRGDLSARPGDPGAQYRLVSLLAARANLRPGREALGTTEELHDRLDTLLRAEPSHPGAHHVLGRIHAAGMRMGGLERFLARTLFGAELLASLSWSEARSHLEAAERGDPCEPAHHYELALLYAERGEAAAARDEIGHALAAAEGARADHAAVVAKARLLDAVRGR